MNQKQIGDNCKLVPSKSKDRISNPRKLQENVLILGLEAVTLIADVFKTDVNSIKNVILMKKGITNQTFTFDFDNQNYIVRIPGVGTEKTINRHQEFEVYNLLKGKEISDNIIYINPNNGYKISEFWKNAIVCDPYNVDHVTRCMNKLKSLHQLEIKVNHFFDLFEKIEYYEGLKNNEHSVHNDYLQTKQHVFSLRNYIDSLPKKISLTHIDSVPDNFLLYNKEVRLIDWEYAAMQDPHIDIAMFAIYSLYDKTQIDQLIEIYFNEEINNRDRTKIYCYVSICGLLWSNWCELKQLDRDGFKEYAYRQYEYAKNYYKIATHEIAKGEI